MRPVIYVDVLFFINFTINYILLFTAARIGRLPCKRLRMAAAASVGGLYAVGIFFPALSLIYTAAAKALSVFAMVAIAYNIRGIRLYIKGVCCFGLVTLCFGGGAFMLLYFTNLGAVGGAVLSNGVLYFNVPWQIPVLGIAVSYLIVRIVTSVLRGKSTGDFAYVKIILGDRETVIKALVDTGNALYDPISSFPVIVAELDSLRPILSEELCSACCHGTDSISAFTYTVNKTARVRIIPYSALGTENGIMLGFLPDKALLLENEAERDIGSVIIGIYTSRLSSDRSFQGLLHPQLMCQ